LEEKETFPWKKRIAKALQGREIPASWRFNPYFIIAWLKPGCVQNSSVYSIPGTISGPCPAAPVRLSRVHDFYVAGALPNHNAMANLLLAVISYKTLFKFLSVFPDVMVD
jgi:hypothetical protein